MRIRFVRPAAVAIVVVTALVLTAANGDVDTAVAFYRTSIVVCVAWLAHRFVLPRFKAYRLQTSVRPREVWGSIAVGATIASLYWFVALSSLRLPEWLGTRWFWLDVVPSAFAWTFVPYDWQSHLHSFFRPGITYCFPGPVCWETLRYLRTAIPAYSLLAFAMIRLAVILSRARRTA